MCEYMCMQYEDNVGVHVWWVGEGMCVYINYQLSVGIYVCKWADTWVYVCVRCSCGVCFMCLDASLVRCSFSLSYKCHLKVV